MRAYWPPEPAENYPGRAIRRALTFFCVLGGLTGLAITLLYWRKNFVEFPLQGASNLLVVLFLLTAPVTIVNRLRAAAASWIVLGVSFVLVVFLAFAQDGLLSVKSQFMLSIVMIATLMLGLRGGILFGSAALATVVCLHLLRDSIGGNLNVNFNADDMSFLLAVGLSATIVFVVLGAGVFAREMERAIKHLQAARRKAQAADKAKSRILATVGHELRTPLAGIMHMTQLLEKNASTSDRASVIKTIEQSSDALLAVIDDILDTTTIESQTLPLARKPFSLVSVAENILRLLQGNAKEKGLNLRLRSHIDMPSAVLGDSVRIGQVLTNLVSNAIKYTDYGVVSIELSAELQDDVVGVEIKVSDTGIGIADAQQQTIFEPFAKSPEAPAATSDGIGLGLFIVKGIVDSMHGEIGVISAPGHGSQFKISLPLAAAPVEPAPTQGFQIDSAFYVTEHPKCMIAESLIRPCVKTLTTFDSVKRLREAMLAGAAQPALIVLCENADNRYALLTAEVLRGDTLTANVPLLLLTDEISTDRLQQCYTLPQTRLMPLPATPADFQRNLQSLLNTDQRQAPRSSVEVPDTSPVAEHVSGCGERVLVAEDNPINRLYLQKLLPMHGFVAEFAVNGEEAVSLYSERPFDVILMDISMPVLDGVGATQKIREIEVAHCRTRTPVIALTAYAAESDLERFLGAGLDDYVGKPYKMALLVDKILAWTKQDALQTGEWVASEGIDHQLS